MKNYDLLTIFKPFRDGFFFSAILSLPADKVAEFRRQLRLNDNILRTMFMESAEKASV